MTDFSVRESQVLSVPRTGVRVSPSAALGVSAVALGVALQVNFGQYDPAALGYLAVAIWAGLLGAAGVARGRVSTAGVMPVLGIGLGLQFLILLYASPMATLNVTSAGKLLVFRMGVVCAAGFLVLAVHGGRWGRFSWWGVLATHFLLGLWVLRAMPQPGVDVCLFQREAGRALLGGHNPYAMSFPNLYPEAARVYGAGTFSGDRLLFGFPYPPLSLLMVLPGQLLGDFRLSHLLATTLAGGLIAAARPGRVATAAGALFLFTSRGFFVLEAGWTEPLAVLLFASIVYFACRVFPTVSVRLEAEGISASNLKALLFESRLNRGTAGDFWLWSLCVSLALLVVVKQYLVLLAPMALWLMWPQGTRMRRPVLGSVLIAMCVTAPLALWNARAFVWSVGLLQFHQPLRPDSLSFLPGLIELFRVPGAAVIPFILALAVTLWCVLRFPRTPSAFAAATAFAFLLFFAFNKQAFCNYYFFVIGAMCCAVAAGSTAGRDVDQSEVTL